MKRVLYRHLCLSLVGVVCLLATSTAFGQSAAFTYQGRLTDGGNPAAGLYDMQFKLFDSADFVTGNQIGATITNLSVQVTNGVFTVQLDFGACATCFDGSARFLEIGVRPAGSPAAFNVLSPRQPITSSPYAVRSATAAVADTAANATQLGGQPPSGFIQNSTSQQSATNFNISGSGTVGGTLAANTVNATTQYNINGSRVLSLGGNSTNLFVGVGAGAANTTGSGNSFFGFEAGKSNTTACCNTYFGESAGKSSVTAVANSFFGSVAGEKTTSGFNSFFGNGAGFDNTTGTRNSFFGSNAGQDNITGSNNSFFGLEAGFHNITGSNNSFFGLRAGRNNNAGNNSFFGFQAGFANTVGEQNSFFGNNAGEINTIGANNSFFGNDAGGDNTSGNQNAFFGTFAGSSNTTGTNNSFFGHFAGSRNRIGQNNTFIGRSADFNIANPTGDSNTLLGDFALVNSGVSRSTAIGSQAQVTQSNSLVLGAINGVNFATADTNVGIGTTSPAAALHLQRDGISSDNWQSAQLRISGATDANMQLNIGYDTTANRGVIQAGQANVSFKDLLLNPFGGNIGIGTISPSFKLHVNGSVAGVGPYQDLSDLRYKRSIQPISDALEKVLRLRGVSYDWRQDEFPEMNFAKGRRVGFIAQEVEQIFPEAVTKDARGFYTIAYSSVTPLLVEAIKQQQKTVEQLRQENADLRERLAALEQAVEKLIKK